MAAKKILLTSRDPALLETRKMLLADNNYEVFTATNHQEVVDLCKDHSFDLAVLGYTIPAKERKNIANTVHEACGPIPILELHNGPVPRSKDSENNLQMDAERSPAEFVAKVKQLLKDRTEPAKN
jgi:CheY-like chemotaxis protein